jgi:lysocardiolipin and lysophospholipid acyltransferase
MRFFGFVFLSRRWCIDQERITHRVKQLSTGYEREDPVALLIYPEGTFVNQATRESMRRYAAKINWVSYSIRHKTKYI